MSQDTSRKVNLAELAAGDGWDVVQTWNRNLLEDLALEVGVQAITTYSTKDELFEAIVARVDEHRRAVVPEAETKPVSKVYRVTGPHQVHGTKPGKTFAAVLPADQEAALIEGGHIKEETKERA